MKYGLYEDRRAAAAALAKSDSLIGVGYRNVEGRRVGGISDRIGGGIGSFGRRIRGGVYGDVGERKREDYVESNKTTKRNFFDRAGDHLRSYGSTAGKIGFLSMFPIGFVAGFGGTFIYDSGKFAYDTILYLANSFPNYSFSDVFKGAWNYFASVPIDALISGIKDGVVAGLGGTVFASWIKRKIFGK